MPYLSKAITDNNGMVYLQLSAGLHGVLGWLAHEVIRLDFFPLSVLIS